MTDTGRKVQRGRFVPWHYESEIVRFEEESHSGWHLTHRTGRKLEYEYDPTIQYRYAMDYRAGHREDRYLELCREDGWEPLGAISDPFEKSGPHSLKASHPAEGCWYVFRKAYDPALPEGEYHLNTDESSLREFSETLERKYRLQGFLWLFLLALPLAGMLIWGPYGPAWLFLAFSGVMSGIQWYRVLCVRRQQPIRPRRWLEGTVSLLAVLLLLLSVGTAAADLASWYARVEQARQNTAALSATEKDPLAFLIEDAGYLTPEDEVAVYATDTVTILLCADGRSFFFQKNDPADSLWLHLMGTGLTEDGLFYTVPAPYGVYPGHCRLMDGEGNTYEPVYEAEFPNGYVPLFALDVSAGQEYRCVLYTVDERGEPRFDLCGTNYLGLADWSMTEEEAEKAGMEYYSFPDDVLPLLPGGTDFTRSWSGWRTSLLASSPSTASDTGSLFGLDTFYAFHVTHQYPPCFILTKETLFENEVYRDYWLDNQYIEYLYVHGEDSATYLWSQCFGGDLSGLVGAETVTPEALRQAAATVQSFPSYYAGTYYGRTLTYDTAIPEELTSLWSELCAR